MIIVVDGPAASGKSSTARAVAARLAFRHLDSGAFYRALTAAALAAGIPEERWPALTTADLDALGVHARPDDGGFALFAGERALVDEIRAPAVNAGVSHMARVPAVREWLLGRLRAAGRGSDLVADGRDMGTVVFPGADLKFFLVADPEVRARRRLGEYGVRHPAAAEVAAETRRLLERDRLDSERKHAPLRRAPDAIVVDTTALSFEDQVGLIVSHARKLLSRKGAGPAGP
jgi:cytidylate kinase